MIYIYDILLNFCDNDCIYDFYEWNNNDDIENIKRIKLVHISRDIYDDFLNRDICIDKDFLVSIYNTCEIYCDKRIKTLNYACLFSDGSRVVAIEFNKDGKSIYKSKLLLDEEDEIAILASNLELSVINYNRGNIIFEDRYYTRTELIIKKYLLLEITNAYKNKEYDKLKFLYQEYFDNMISSYKKMYLDLKNSLDIIDDRHKDIYNLLKLVHKKKQV